MLAIKIAGHMEVKLKNSLLRHFFQGPDTSIDGYAGWGHETFAFNAFLTTWPPQAKLQHCVL